MDQPVPGGDDLPPGDLRGFFAHDLGNAGGGFADQLEVAKRRIVGHGVCHKCRLIEANRLTVNKGNLCVKGRFGYEFITCNVCACQKLSV